MMDVKERILEKADELFNRYGIRSVSMDEMASQLGMSKKTLYQYFADKEELVDAVLSSTLIKNKQDCQDARKAAENAIHEVFISFDRVQEMFSQMNPAMFFDLQKYHPNVYRKFHEYKYTFLYQIIRANIETGIKQELYRPEVDVDILTRLRIETVMLPFDATVFPNNRTQLIHIEQQILDLFLFGMTTPKGQKLVQKYKTQRQKKA